MADIDHGYNCDCIGCPCLRHKGCQACQPDYISITSNRPFKGSTEYMANYHMSQTDSRKNIKPYGQRVEDIAVPSLRFTSNSENRAMFQSLRGIVPEKVQPQHGLKTYQENTDTFYKSTTHKHDYPGWKPFVRPPRQRDVYDMTPADALNFLTTTNADFRDFHLQGKHAPDMFTKMKESELKFEYTSTNRSDFQNWQKCTRPKKHTPPTDFFKSDETRDFVTTTGVHHHGMKARRQGSPSELIALENANKIQTSVRKNL